MKEAEQEKYKQKLLALGKRLNTDLSHLQSEALRTAGGETSGNLSNAPLHMADLGTDTFEQELNFDLIENQDRLAEEISAALARIEAGTYGQCENCGLDIAPDRLDAVPYALAVRAGLNAGQGGAD